MVSEDGGEGGRTGKATAATEEMERFTDEVEDGEIVGEGEEGEAEGVNAHGDGAPPEKQRLCHHLEHSWTLWFDNPSGKSKQAAWGSSIRPIYTFSTVEEFWGLYNNIRRPSNLAVGADVHCFKNGIEPKWEDPVCTNGGKWTISCSRGKVDMWWLHTMLAMIGEQFDHGDDICGAVVNVRAKQEKISIWTKNGSNQTAQMSIGKQWKNALDYIETIGFILHDDAKKHDRHAKSSYQV